MNFNPTVVCAVGQNAVSSDFAMSSNNIAPDYQLPQFMTNIKFANVNDLNKVYMYDPSPGWINEEDCVNWNCTGPFNAIVFDKDGSIVGGTGGYVLANNPGIAKKDICTLYSNMNAYFCPSSEEDYYMMLVMDSLDSDFATRTFSPVNITSYGDTFKSHMGDY